MSEYQAKSIVAELRANFVRVEGDYSTNKIVGKIQDAEQLRVHTMLVIGPRDVEAGAVSVRMHGKGNLGAKPQAEVIADILSAIKQRSGGPAKAYEILVTGAGEADRLLTGQG